MLHLLGNFHSNLLIVDTVVKVPSEACHSIKFSLSACFKYKFVISTVGYGRQCSLTLKSTGSGLKMLMIESWFYHLPAGRLEQVA